MTLARRPPLLLAATAIAVLAGCAAVGPDYQRPPVEVPAQWRSQIDDAADVANTSWWEAFGDPELSELVRAALDGNRDLRAAVFRIDQFNARLQISNSANKPQVGYHADGARKYRSEEQPNELGITGVPTYNDFTIGLTFAWEIDIWGRIRRSNEAALADLLSAEAAQRGVMLTTVCAVATAYVQLLGLDRELAVTRLVVNNRQRTYDVLKAKQEGGSATQVAVEEARAAIEEAASTIPDIERRIASTEFALSTLVGRNPGPIKRRTMDQLTLLKVPEGVPSDLLVRRPDVFAAEQNLTAANARIGVAKAEYLPTVSLTGALGLQSDQLQWLFAKTARTGEFWRGLTGTLFSGGRVEGTVREAEAVRNQMAERYLLSVQTGLQEVEDSLVARAKAGEQGQIRGRQVGALQEATRLTQLRYESGQSTLLDVLEAQRQVFVAQAQQAQSQRDQFLALVAVYKAMGGGWMVEQNRLRETRAAAAAAAASAPPANN